MTVSTINVGLDERINAELELASKNSQPVKLVTKSGQTLIAFPSEGFDKMCDIVQTPEFAQSLRQGLTEYSAGKGRLFRKGEHP